MTDNTIKEFTTASGLPMTEYVPMDYPRSGVVYSHMPTEQALASAPGLVPLPVVEGAFVAGGYAADLLFNKGDGEPRDVDIWFKSKEAFEEMFYRLVVLGYAPASECLQFIDPVTKKLVWTEEFEKQVPYVEFTPPFEERLAYQSKTVQLVKIRWYDSAEAAIDAFDYTVVQVAFDLGKGECIFNPMGAVHYLQRLIVQHRVESRARVLMRLDKYEQKGFSRSADFVLPEEAKVEVTT